jgi:hypothetical protein
MAIIITSFIPKKGAKHKEQYRLYDNGVYSFLYPFFVSLFERKGKMIDLYGVSNFSGNDLVYLEKVLDEAIKAANSQPEQWDQKIGEMAYPKKQILYDKVLKSDILMTINLLKDITFETIKNNAVIVFEGL